MTMARLRTALCAAGVLGWLVALAPDAAEAVANLRAFAAAAEAAVERRGRRNRASAAGLARAASGSAAATFSGISLAQADASTTGCPIGWHPCAGAGPG
jgi:hypothetical protein